MLQFIAIILACKGCCFGESGSSELSHCSELSDVGVVVVFIGFLFCNTETPPVYCIITLSNMYYYDDLNNIVLWWTKFPKGYGLNTYSKSQIDAPASNSSTNIFAVFSNFVKAPTSHLPWWSLTHTAREYHWSSTDWIWHAANKLNQPYLSTACIQNIQLRDQILTSTRNVEQFTEYS
jgi:hypothetical protein